MTRASSCLLVLVASLTSLSNLYSVFFCRYLPSNGSLALVQRENSFREKLRMNYWSSPNKRPLRPEYADIDHGSCGNCPQELQYSTFWKLQDVLEVLQAKKRWIVNIGAASYGGGRYDPVFPILLSNHSYDALIIDPNKKDSLWNAYPTKTNIKILYDYVWPETMGNILKEQNIPHNDIALVKIDVDSYDCNILHSLLKQNYTPNVLHVEFNPIFPPPISFIPTYDAKQKFAWSPPLWVQSGPFYGCSLTALNEIATSFGYVLLQVEAWDAVFLKNNLVLQHGFRIPVDEIAAYSAGFTKFPCIKYCTKNPKLFNQEILTSVSNSHDWNHNEIQITSKIHTMAPKIASSSKRHPFCVTYGKTILNRCIDKDIMDVPKLNTQKV